MNPIHWIFRRALLLKPIKTGWLSAHLCALDLGYVNVFLYRKDDALIAFDTGNGKRRLRRELGHVGIDPGCVTHVFLSHADFDHAGCLDVFPNARFCLSEDEQKNCTPPRPLRFKIARNPLQLEHAFMSDGETTQVGSITVKAIKAPGHTAGSMAYLVNGHILFTGDTLTFRRGEIVPNPAFVTDRKTIRASAEMLKKLPGVELIVTAHVGVSEGRFS